MVDVKKGRIRGTTERSKEKHEIIDEERKQQRKKEIEKN